MMDSISVEEISLFETGDISCKDLSESLFLYLHNEDWESLFQDSVIKAIIELIIDAAPLTNVSEEVETYINTNSCCNDKKGQNAVCLLGIASLKLFLQENWTGPPIDLEQLGNFKDLLTSKVINDNALHNLESSGEEIYSQTKYPLLLLLADTILVKSAGKFQYFHTLPIWSIKCIAAYLAVLEETRDIHFKEFKETVEKVKSNCHLEKLPKQIQAEFHLDCSHIYLHSYDYDSCKACFDEVKRLLQIEFSLTAALGKRTKFQQFDLAQMKLDINVNETRERIQTKGEVTKDLPTDVVLDEETLLPNIQFVDGDGIRNIDLSPLDQAYAVASCIYLQKTRPRDKLTHEEILPFITQVLMSPQCWSVQYKSLFTRCVMEFSNSRKAERALTQLESLIASHDKSSPKASERLKLIQSVDLKPKWQSQQVNAQLLYAVGCTDSALETFLALHLWDDVIMCYQRLGKHGKAEAAVREQLAKRETATLWNLLGDATIDKEYYEKAWEFSKHRNARSQRSIGLWHLRKDEFAEAVPFFQKSLELNYLQPGIAFSLGCCLMRTNDLSSAAKAFQHCVSLDPDNPQAWNNLASNFIRINQLPKAYKALQEASRLSYDNWKIWENFLLVSADIGAFDECMHCFDRLVDLGRKDLDIQALVILTDAILSGEVDNRGQNVSRLKPKLFKLFGHITSKITTSASIWQLYARLSASSGELADREKALQLLYKSHRCYTQHTNWEKAIKSVPAVMNVTSQMMEATIHVCSDASYKARAISLYSTTRMSISNLIIRLKKAYVNDTKELLEEVRPHIDILNTYMTELKMLSDSLT